MNLRRDNYRNRVQVRNPITNKYVKINTEIGSIIGHKHDGKPYKNVRDATDDKPITIEQLRQKQPVKIDPIYAKKHIRCNCGHYSREHYLGEGWCHGSNCGCTWYYPNDKWLRRKQSEANQVRNG